MTDFFNDGTRDEPKPQVWLNLDSLHDLRPGSRWSEELNAQPAERGSRLAADGFEGVQLTRESGPASPVLPHCGLDRISEPAKAEAVVARHAEAGKRCLTVHVGWGWEDDASADRLVEAVLAASQRHRLPVFIETHRATITQDVWRTVRIVRSFPGIRFNGDFSHYYCGQELAYGAWPARLAGLAPIFERVGFLHGRIASSCCMQVPIDPDWATRPRLACGHADYLAHFRDLWTGTMRGFLRSAAPGGCAVFCARIAFACLPLRAGFPPRVRLSPGGKRSLRAGADLPAAGARLLRRSAARAARRRAKGKDPRSKLRGI